MSRDFSFKQFTVQQTRAAFKVGTDSVVLGAWADVADARHILDIGTGTGLLALQCAQRNAEARIDAIEKDALSAEDAAHNFALSPWADRLNVYTVALENFSAPAIYDYIICNPPYFLQALLPDDHRKADARHANKEWFALLAATAERCTSVNGRLGCILPDYEFGVLSKELGQQHWFLHRMQQLRPYPGGKKVRILAEWHRTYSAAPLLLPDIHVRTEEGSFHEDYYRLTHPFYLKF